MLLFLPFVYSISFNAFNSWSTASIGKVPLRVQSFSFSTTLASFIMVCWFYTILGNSPKMPTDIYTHNFLFRLFRFFYIFFFFFCCYLPLSFILFLYYNNNIHRKFVSVVVLRARARLQMVEANAVHVDSCENE